MADMSSELTIDIQLTELGFSSWDFQVLKQKETHQTADLEYASSSSSSSSTASTSTTTTATSLPSTSSSSTTTTTALCPIAVEILVDEETNVGHFTPVVCPKSLQSDQGLQVNLSSVPVESTETSTTVCEKESGNVGGKRRRCPWYEENVDEPLKEDKKKKTDKDKKDKLQEPGTGSSKLTSDDEFGEEEENEEDEDEDYEEDDMTDGECGDGYSSDTNDSEEHRCQVCNLTFSSSFLLHEHLHIHNGVRLYQCAECGKRFCHLVNYRKHLRSHREASTIRCIICRTQFATQLDLRQHLDTNHFEDEFYQCDLCKRIFTSMADCKKHVQTHKRRTKRYPCPKCEHSFRHRSSMLYHLKRHSKGVFVCTDCGLAFSTKAVLLRHSFHHLGVLPYTCIRCKRHFRLSSHYMKHECKPEQLQCVACLIVFQSQEDFLKHKKDTGCWGHQTALSTKTNDIRCMECGQVFISSEELKKHAGTHQRVMKCSECGMGFRSSIMLMSHMGGHAATRPCLCKECGLGFCHQQAYDSHLKTCGLVNPAEIATKKQKPNSKKKEAVTTPKSKEIQTVPQPMHLHPTALVSGQTKPAEGLTPITLNKEPVSPIPLVMILPVPSTSTSDSIQNAQKLNSDLSKKSLSAPPVIHNPLPSNNCSVCEETGKTVMVKDIVRPVSGSSILIPLTSATGSVTAIYATRKENGQVTSIMNAKNEQIRKGLSSSEIQQVLNMIKKNVCGDTNLSVVLDNAKMKADDEKQEGLRLENSISPIKRQPAENEIPELLIHSSSSKFSLNPESLSKNTVQNTNTHTEEEDLQLDVVEIILGDRSDVVQCDVCGKLISEKDFVQHNMNHSGLPVLGTS